MLPDDIFDEMLGRVARPAAETPEPIEEKDIVLCRRPFDGVSHWIPPPVLVLGDTADCGVAGCGTGVIGLLCIGPRPYV